MKSVPVTHSSHPFHTRGSDFVHIVAPERRSAQDSDSERKPGSGILSPVAPPATHDSATIDAMQPPSESKRSRPIRGAREVARVVTPSLSLLLAVVATVVVVAASATAAVGDDVASLLDALRTAGIALVVLSAGGAASGVLGSALNLRPPRPSLALALLGFAANLALLYLFAPSVLCLYF